MGRAPCCDKANVKKGPWSPEEDTKLKEYIEKHGTGGNWIALPQKAGLKRCGKSCRLRWLNYLRPNLKHGEFSEEEDRIICSLFANIGSRWSIIAAQLPGRTDNDIKNYWNTKLKKKLMGVFPPSQRKPAPFRSTDHHNPSCPYQSLPSSMYKEYSSSYCCTSSSIGHETISVPSNYPNKAHSFAANYMPEMLQTNKDVGLFGSMQMHYLAATEDNLMFGSEGSTCSSSKGSCSTHIRHKREIKQEDQMGSRQNSISTITNKFEENLKCNVHDHGIGSTDIGPIGAGNGSLNVNHWINMSNGGDPYFGENSDYHVAEDIKQVLISSTNYNDGFSNNLLN